MKINNKIYKYLTEEYHYMDNLLDDITFEELLTQVYSNVPQEKIDTKTVMKEFESLLKGKIKDAKFEIKKAAPQIVKYAMDK